MLYASPVSAQNTPSAARPSIMRLMLPGNVPLDLVLVEAGSFMMGSPYSDGDALADEKPQRRVTLTDDYYLGKYEITQAQWEAVMRANPSYFKGADRPVERVSWDDIQVFLKKVNGLLQAEGQVGLPTEAQWEYAARGGKKSQGYLYAGSNRLGKVAWHEGNSGKKTHSVGSKAPNALGLYDMSGNVIEWCADMYGEEYYAASGATDPLGPASGDSRVFRGGSCNSDAEDCRIVSRDCEYPDDSSNHDGGFRVAFFPVD